MAQINCPFPLCQSSNQFGLFDYDSGNDDDDDNDDDGDDDDDDDDDNDFTGSELEKHAATVH